MRLTKNNKEDMPKTIYLGYQFRAITLDRIYEIAKFDNDKELIYVDSVTTGKRMSFSNDGLSKWLDSDDVEFIK